MDLGLFESIGSELEGIYGNLWLVLLMFVYLGIATYTDIKERKIYNWLNGGMAALYFFLIPFFGFSWLHLVGGAVGFVAMLIPAMIKNQSMGGDIKASGVIGLHIGLVLFPVFMLLTAASFVTYVVSCFLRKQPVGFLPMAPFFMGAHIGMFLVYLSLPLF